tara:strand:- start:227 stop:523 length:297 start_codon:yes stop_codon:yes gene_type:complete
MKKKNIEKFLLNKINEFLDENDLEINEEINLNTRLIGSSSLFDSMDLVSFIVEVEQDIEEKFNLRVQLATERAMSRRSSPFISLETLANYIIEIAENE